jgi:phosphoenolpyruvate carboxykinase (ATP)
VHWNLSVPELYEAALRRGEGHIAEGGPLVFVTAPFTGRSPKDRFIVEDALTSSEVWWGGFNTKIAPAAFDRLYERVAAYLRDREVFVQDLQVGSDPLHRLPVRVITESAYHSLFCRNMFVHPAEPALPEFTVINVPSFRADPQRDGTRSETFILINFSRRMILVGGTGYAGENKKGLFGVLNFLLPAQGVLPMHCSANAGDAGDVALFFGLSGTGKTTLSSDSQRHLIGDDEHGWSDAGVFNFEGGCYAKVIHLDAAAEPAIASAAQRFGTVLENVVMREDRTLDFEDASLTENTRAAYPIEYMDGIVPGGLGGHPQHIFFLTADAFGVLPPISRLSRAQMIYHFVSGYTAKIPGTERGVTEPSATFSTCFGAPFMPRHPKIYAEMLADRVELHGSKVWLVNTGWTGGPYGTGRRISIADTRRLLRAVLAGELERVQWRREPFFGLEIPTAVPGVPSEILSPQLTWADPQAYLEAANRLARMFRENFARFTPDLAEVAGAMPDPTR